MKIKNIINECMNECMRLHKTETKMNTNQRPMTKLIYLFGLKVNEKHYRSFSNCYAQNIESRLLICT